MHGHEHREMDRPLCIALDEKRRDEERADDQSGKEGDEPEGRGGACDAVRALGAEADRRRRQPESERGRDEDPIRIISQRGHTGAVLVVLRHAFNSSACITRPITCCYGDRSPLLGDGLVYLVLHWIAPMSFNAHPEPKGTRCKKSPPRYRAGEPRPPR